MASLILVNIGSGSGLLSFQYLSITQTSADYFQLNIEK